MELNQLISNGDYIDLFKKEKLIFRHYKKDETFHILHGTVIVVRNDIKHILNKGDIIDIRAGYWHSFESKEGAIFEEVSTASIIGDSEYQDIKINNLDPYERKSQIYKW